MVIKNLSTITIILTVIGVGLLAFNQVSMGLTLIFLGGALMASVFIHSRLKKIGSENWAVGSIIVWIGFFLFAVPIFFYAWNIGSTLFNILSSLIGIIFIILGYMTEYLDLNLKLLKLWDQFLNQLRDSINNIKKRIFRSVWSILIFIDAIIILLVFIFQDLTSKFNTTISNYIGISLISLLLIILIIAVIIEFREIIWITINKSSKTFIILIHAIYGKLLHLPEVMYKFIFRIGKLIKKLTNILLKGVILTVENIYLVSFLMAFILIIVRLFSDGQFITNFGFSMNSIPEYIRFLSSNGVLWNYILTFILLGIVMLLVQKQEQIISGVNEIQQRSYSTTIRIKNRLRRKKIICPYCNSVIPAYSAICPHCRNIMPQCMVCKNIIVPGEPILKCKTCGNYAHKEHLTQWLKIKNQCPYCKSIWE